MSVTITTRYTGKRKRPKSDFKVKKDSKTKEVLNPEVVSLTKQSERDSSNINTIVAKANRTGFLGSGIPSQRQAHYGDFTDGVDFQESQERVARFRTMFEELPSDLRNKFANDPSQFLDWVKDPANEKEAQDLGLLPKPKHTFKKVETEDGKVFKVYYKDGVEINRHEVESTPKAEETAPAPVQPKPEA